MKSTAGVARLLIASAVAASCATTDENRPDGHVQPAAASAPSPALYRDTQQVNQHQLVELYSKKNNDRILSITTSGGDTVVNYASHYFQHKYLDINKDGDLDIRVYIFSNTPNQCDNYFYDRTTRTYHKISNSNLDIAKLPGTSLYYSYSRIGCGGMRWASALSKIENWREINIGYVKADYCNADTKEIYIYKASNNEQKLIETIKGQKLPHVKDIPAFINRYWQRNYKRFE